MPNDPAGSFPVPEVKLTDEVAPDLSANPVDFSAPQEQEPTYQVPAATPIPATMPAGANRPFPVATLLLLLISVGAIAATYFFYQQSKNLNLQLNQITKTLEQQTIKENQVTITPTMDVSPLPTSTTSAQISITPTSSLNKGTGPVWGIIGDVMAAAQKQYPSAQLILIKAENVNAPSQTIKYWFRQNTSDRKYLYLLKETGKDLSLVDQNVTVFETNLIPSLNSYFTNGQLGLDLPEAVSIATATCPASFDCLSTTITGQYIKSNTILWQITYKPSDNRPPFVVQIDAATKKIIYKNQ